MLMLQKIKRTKILRKWPFSSQVSQTRWCSNRSTTRTHKLQGSLRLDRSLETPKIRGTSKTSLVVMLTWTVALRIQRPSRLWLSSCQVRVKFNLIKSQILLKSPFCTQSKLNTLSQRYRPTINCLSKLQMVQTRSLKRSLPFQLTMIWHTLSQSLISMMAWNTLTRCNQMWFWVI